MATLPEPHVIRVHQQEAPGLWPESVSLYVLGVRSLWETSWMRYRQRERFPFLKEGWVGSCKGLFAGACECRPTCVCLLQGSSRGWAVNICP